MPGIITSSRTRSGAALPISLRAVGPSSAVTTSYCTDVSALSSSDRFCLLSSTARMRGIPLPVHQLPEGLLLGKQGPGHLQQLARAVWLCHIGGRSSLLRLLVVATERKRRNHDDRDSGGLGVGAKAACRVQSGHLGELDVHQDQVGNLLERRCHPQLAIRRLNQPVCGPRQKLPHHLQVKLVVFYVKNRFAAHVTSP